MIFDKISEFNKVSFHFYMLIIIYLSNYYYFVFPKGIVTFMINGFIFGTYLFYILSSTLRLVSENKTFFNEIENQKALLRLEKDNHKQTQKNAIKTIQEIRGIRK